MLPSVGLDRRVAVFAALSNGTKIKPLNAFEAIQDKLAKAQRKLARRTKFSANWKKQKAKISRLHMRAANARKDFLHKLSTDLAKSHSVIKIEKLQIQNMTRSAKGTVAQPGTNVQAKSRLNRSILDQGWGMFARVLNYKLAERGGELVYVDPPAPRRRVPNAVSSTRPAGATKRSSYAPIAATKTTPMSTARAIFIRPGHWPVSLSSEP